MSIGLQITVHGDEEIEKLFARLTSPQFSEMLGYIGGHLESSTNQRFADEKDPLGNAWQEWSEKYARTRHGGQRKLMSGRNASGEPSQNLHRSFSWQIKGGTLVFGTNVTYAAVHQFGSKKKSGRGSGIPARPFLGINDHDRKEIREIVEEFIDELVSG